MFTPHIFPSLILTTIFISLYIPTSLSQQYEPNCTNLYACGQNLQPIGYPFSGQNRHSSCGLPGFELHCREQDNITTIVISSQTYRVLEINPNDRTITLALAGDVCSVESIGRGLNETLFGYDSDEVEYLNLYYSCPGLNIPTRETIRCTGDRNTDRRLFYWNQSVTPADLQSCDTSVGVPVNRTLFREFEESEMISLQELIRRGVRVEYKYDGEACLKCEKSKGLCWSGTNNTRPSCYCRDGIRFGQCSGSDGNIPLKAGIGVGVSTIWLAIGVIIYFCCRKSSCRESLAFWKSRTKNDKNIEAFITQYGFSTPKRYKFFEIKRMTNSFKHELGKGGFGTVFKGMLQDGSLVAVKVLKESKGNGEEFINEVASIGRTSHINIVALLGFCYEGKKRALVYEFMPNGSLEKFINHNLPTESTQHLAVEKLFEIAVGIARGLEYLHRGCNTRILHFDIKPHNILLGEDFCPKIADFGLAKLHTNKDSIISMVEARGTIGYIAPEVFNRNFGGVSHKSDVYSYGMMVLEMVGGRKNINIRVNHSSDIYFPQWIYKQLELDEDLRMPIIENEIARKMIIVGLWCIQPNPSERPSIRKVVEMLEGTIEVLQIPPNPIFASPPRSPVTSSHTLESSISLEYEK